MNNDDFDHEHYAKYGDPHGELTALPTREQIAEALYETQFRNEYHADWDRLVDDARDFWLSQADAVLALIQKEVDQ